MGEGDPGRYADVCMRIHARIIVTLRTSSEDYKNDTSSFFIIPQHARLPGGAPGLGT